MGEIKVILTHDDFVKSSGYISNTNCALAIAIKRQLQPKQLRVGGTFVEMDNIKYEIKEVNISYCPILEGYDKLENNKTIETFEVTLVN